MEGTQPRRATAEDVLLWHPGLGKGTTGRGHPEAAPRVQRVAFQELAFAPVSGLSLLLQMDALPRSPWAPGQFSQGRRHQSRSPDVNGAVNGLSGTASLIYMLGT